SAVARILRSKGIMTLTGDPIVEVADTVKLESGDEVEYDAFVWTGGLTAHNVGGDTEIPRGRRDAYEVDTKLRATNLENVFVAGDAAYLEGVPATAWAAKQEGRLAAKNVARRTRDDSLETLDIMNPGTLVSVGDEAVGEVGGQVVTRETAKLLKKAAAVRHVTQVAGASRGVESVFSGV
ncbi:MAG: FAD-dependent oxidoreductase, partial [Halobacteria archaeon]|nr:FAD-dependent oxidoreductase [Halobacteria archaeon]